MQIARAILPLDSFGRIEREFLLKESESPSQFHHLVRVLRIKPGWKVELLDELTSRKIPATVQSISTNEILLETQEQQTTSVKVSLTLLLGLPEFDVLERVIEKAVELQLDYVKIFVSEHTQTKDAFSRLTGKLLRLEKIRNAARVQSGSAPLKIEIYSKLEEALSSSGSPKERAQLKLIASLQAGAANLQEFLHKKYPIEPSTNITDTILVIGPEGDLSFEEYKLCGEFGFNPVSLGTSVLRVETAAISAAFCIFNYFNR